MADIVRIYNTEITPLEAAGQRVITLDMMDKVHERPMGTAGRTFRKHQARLREGKHYFRRNTSEAQQLGMTAPNGLVLLTETGYLLLVKTFRDELAWQIQEQLIEGYFRTVTSPALPTLHDPALQAIMHMTVDLDATKYRLAQVEQALIERQLDDVRIEAKADAAYHNQNFWTIAEYVQYHGLRRQCPESAYVEASNHMRAYCKREKLNFRDPNVFPRRIPVGDKNWETEWGFHTSVYEDAFMPWLLRRNSQASLHIIHTQEHSPHA